LMHADEAECCQQSFDKCNRRSGIQEVTCTI
jgi:hypothetical protein